ncbi:MAG: sigma-70 family RNA polymerase sigma factor [Planctomycetota bacterium]|nr:sigma-70 family RNA polymerase sigma factor [Planctomycetota bacterium]
MTKRQLEQLLRHQGFLRALARRLLRDAARADDVVQEAWLVALKSNKSPSEVRRGWLAGVVRNLVRRTYRDDVRRARREKVAARGEEVRATDELFTQMMLRRRIAELVLTLPEHYREPILLRFYDGLQPMAIADRLGVSSSTVRTRLQRGLKRIGCTLNEERGGNGRVLGLMLGAIATAPAAGTLSAGTPALSGAAKAAGIAVVLTLGALWLDRAPRTERVVRAPAPEHGGAGAGLTASTTAAPGSRGTREARAKETAVTPVQHAAVLHGVIRLPNGIGSRLVRVAVQPVGAQARPTPTLHTVVQAGSVFHLSVDALLQPRQPRSLLLTALHPDTEPGTAVIPVHEGRVLDPVELRLARRPLVPTELLAQHAPPEEQVEEGEDAVREEEGSARKGARKEAELQRKATHLKGTVELPADASDDPVLLEICRPAQDQQAKRCVRARVRADRAFAVPIDSLLTGALPPTLRVTAWHPDTLPEHVEVPIFADATGAPTLDSVVLTLHGSRLLRGRITFVSGVPADGAEVVAFADRDGMPATSPFGATRRCPRGSFELPLEEDQRYFVVAAAHGYQPAGRSVAAGEGTQDGEVFVLRVGSAISGAVRDSAGNGRAGARVRASLAAEGGRSLVLSAASASLRWTPDGVEWLQITAHTDAEGHYRMGGLAQAEYDVELGGLEGASDVPAGTAQRVSAPGTADFQFGAATLTVAAAASGVPLEDARVRVARVTDAPRPFVELRTDARGLAEFEVVPLAEYRVAVLAPDYQSKMRRVNAPETGGTRRVGFDLQQLDTRATLVVTLRPPMYLGDVRLPAACSFLLTPAVSGQAPLKRTVGMEDGRFFVRDLNPGGYTVVAFPGGAAALNDGYYAPAFGLVALAAGTQTLHTMEVQAGGRLDVLVRGPDGQQTEASLRLEGTAAWNDGPFLMAGAPVWPKLTVTLQETVALQSASPTSQLLHPGRYTLHAMPWDRRFAAQSVSVEIRAGETTRVELRLTEALALDRVR